MPPNNLSKLRSSAQHGIRTSLVGQGAYVEEYVEGLIGKGKFLLSNYKLFQSVPFSTLSHLNNILRYETAGKLDSLASQGTNLTVVGALSRTFSIPSVSGPASQVCGYHIGRSFLESEKSLLGVEKPKIIMAASGTKSILTDYVVDNWISKQRYHGMLRNNATTLSCRRGLDSCIAARMSLKNQENCNKSAIYGYFVYNSLRSRRASNLDPCSGWKDFHSSASTCQTAGTASDLSFDRFSHEDEAAMSKTSSEQQTPLERTLKLLSGSCYLPHPDKEETGGEDAHFICAEEHAIGVADGVGGWADLGINAGLYAQELMSNSVNAIQEEPKGHVDPARVLEKAHSSTKAKGSSTACIIALTKQGLHAINLGDSGFIVVRDGCTVFRSPAQQHDFNFTYQLESGTSGDLPSAGQVFTVGVAPGDVIIAGTDGLFDNLYNNEVTAVVVHAKRAGLGPQVTAQKIAALARQRAQDRNRQTPFSTAAQDAGFRYYGGKLDDITVVVSYITSSSDSEKDSSS